jgi:hypothetical protein
LEHSAALWRRITITGIIAVIIACITLSIEMFNIKTKNPEFTGVFCFLKLPVIFPYRAKNVYQFTVGNGNAAMPGVGRDNSEHTGIQYLGNIVNGHFKFTFNRKGALLMNVLVPRYAAACFYLNKVDGIGSSVN